MDFSLPKDMTVQLSHICAVTSLAITVATMCVHCKCNVLAS